MPCPSCSATMQMIFNAPNHNCWWCSRCGTLTDEKAGFTSHSPPILIQRARQLHECMMEAGQPAGMEALRIMGITEAVYKPEERPS